MAYTHFKGLCATSHGFAVGAAGSESVVINTAGAVTVAGAITATGAITSSGAITGEGVNLNDENATVQMVLVYNTTATQSWYTCAPKAGNITKGYLVHPVAAATSNAVVVNHGTAGATILSFAAVAGTVGTITTCAASGTTAVTQGELLKVTMTAAATSVDQKYQTLVIVMDRT